MSNLNIFKELGIIVYVIRSAEQKRNLLEFMCNVFIEEMCSTNKANFRCGGSFNIKRMIHKLPLQISNMVSHPKKISVYLLANAEESSDKYQKCKLLVLSDLRCRRKEKSRDKSVINSVNAAFKKIRLIFLLNEFYCFMLSRTFKNFINSSSWNLQYFKSFFRTSVFKSIQNFAKK